MVDLLNRICKNASYFHITLYVSRPDNSEIVNIQYEFRIPQRYFKKKKRARQNEWEEAEAKVVDAVDTSVCFSRN